MKNIELHIDDDTSITLSAFRAEFSVRGVVTFEAELVEDDLEFPCELLFGLMKGETAVDPERGEYRVGSIEMHFDDGDYEPADATFLKIKYQGEFNGQTGECALSVPENLMIEFWAKNSEALLASGWDLLELARQGNDRAEKDGLALSMIINALRFVSGEVADFAPAFSAWASANDRDARVHFTSVLPMAA